MSIKEYTSKYYDSNVSMQAIYNAEDSLLNQLEQDLDLVKNNQFVVSADEITISAWERLFNIQSAEGETLPFRRERIINRLTNKPPFNVRFITDKINLLFGSGSYTVFFDQNSLTLVLEGTPDSPERLKEIYITVLSIKPANISYLYHAMDQLDWGNKLYNYTYNGTQTSSLLLSPERKEL